MLVTGEIHHRKRGLESMEYDISCDNAEAILESICALMEQRFQCQLDNPWPQYWPGYVNRIEKKRSIRFASINRIAGYYYKVWYKDSKIVVVPEQ